MSKLAIEVLNDYPLATEAARDWFLKKMIESFEQDNAPEDFKNHMLSRGVSDITLAIMLDQNPRAFFDVLDENKLIVEIIYAGNGLFYFTINDKNFPNSGDFQGRVPCERAAVIAAFEKLNN